MKFTAITQTKHEGDNSIMREGYTSQAKKALAYAVRTAEKCGHNYVGTEHLLIGLLNVEDGTAGMVLSEFHVDAGQLTELIDRLIAPGGNTVTESRPGYTPRVRRVLENAEAEAARFKSRAVGTEHLLIAILKESDCVATRLLFTMGINIQKLYGAILTAMGEAPLQGGASGNANTGRGPQTRGGAQTSETPALDQYSRDLTELAREGKLDPVVGRGQEIERVIQILSRRTKNNPCLIGEPGVGKTAIAEGLAQRIALGIVPETIRDKRVVVLDLSGMVTIALASLIIGESIIGKGGMLQRVTGVILGSCLYRFIVAVALRLNVPAECLKLVSAIIVAVAIAFPYLKKQMNFYRQKRAAKAQNQIYVQEITKNDSEGGER